MKKHLIKWFRISPLTLRMLERFRRIRRGYFSLQVLGVLLLLALLGPLLVSDRALIVSYKGKLHFPTHGAFHPGTDFGLDYDHEVDYRLLKKKFKRENEGNWVLLAPVPFNGREVVEAREELVKIDDLYYFPDGKTLYRDGKAFTVHDTGRRKRVWTIKHGRIQGAMRGYDPRGALIEKANWIDGQMANYTPLKDGLPETWTDDPEMDELLFQHTFPSGIGVGGHPLGTDEAGRDVLARLFGGWKIAITGSLIYVIFTYSIGILVGCTMGYFGGRYDLMMQRFVEIWSAVPFLYIVIILSAFITPNLFSLMFIIIAFSWMGLTYYMRTAAYREKEKEYVQAARVLGASNRRIIFYHILPNTISIIVTFIPFSISGLIGSLIALNFLGFGLPPTEPTWGEMLKQGTEHFESPWILSSVFIALVTVLVLVTFVGEAVREAFDPKKFTVYK